MTSLIYSSIFFNIQNTPSLLDACLPSFVLYGVPQGSVLGPILFVLYVADVLQLVKYHGLMPHAYADDTRIFGICCPSESEALHNRVSDCLNAVGSC